jgi:hypothetical protein
MQMSNLDTIGTSRNMLHSFKKRDRIRLYWLNRPINPGYPMPFRSRFWMGSTLFGVFRSIHPICEIRDA